MTKAIDIQTISPNKNKLWIYRILMITGIIMTALGLAGLILWAAGYLMRVV